MLTYLERPSSSATTVVFFHGYGASAEDLFPLSHEIRFEARYLFPNGPLTVPIGPGFTGRAWFPINVRAIEQAAMTGQVLDYSKESSAHMKPAVDKVLRFFQDMKVNTSNLILGGFSQGAMLSTELALHLPTPPKALILLSGTLIDEERLRTEYKSRASIKIFQSHGTEDMVLPIAPAQRLSELFSDAGLKVDYQEFEGGHEIPQHIVDRLNQFLRRI